MLVTSKENMGQQFEGHGDTLDFAKHEGIAMRLVKSERALDWDTGEEIKPTPDALSVITPENKNPLNKPGEPNHWKNWWKDPNPEMYSDLKNNFDTWQKDPNVQYKVNQIKRSCPVCKALSYRKIK